MEYIAGQTLAEVIHGSNRVGIGRKVQWLWELASGLEFAHRHGIVHRDVKPSNLMICKDSGLLRLLDFGIARDHESDATMSGVAVGTPHYMSPEQVTGQPVDARSDVFAFGSVAYELLSSQRAFDGAHAFEITRKVLETEPVPLTELVSGLPVELVRLVEGCLVKSLEGRMPSLTPVLSSLRRIARALEGSDDLTVIRATPTPSSAPFGPLRQPAGAATTAGGGEGGPCPGRPRGWIDDRAVEAADEAAMLDEHDSAVHAVLRDTSAHNRRASSRRSSLPRTARSRRGRRPMPRASLPRSRAACFGCPARTLASPDRGEPPPPASDPLSAGDRGLACWGHAAAAVYRFDAEPPEVQADPVLLQTRDAIAAVRAAQAAREAQAQAAREEQAREARAPRADRTGTAGAGGRRGGSCRPRRARGGGAGRARGAGAGCSRRAGTGSARASRSNGNGWRGRPPRRKLPPAPRERRGRSAPRARRRSGPPAKSRHGKRRAANRSNGNGWHGRPPRKKLPPAPRARRRSAPRGRRRSGPPAKSRRGKRRAASRSNGNGWRGEAAAAQEAAARAAREVWEQAVREEREREAARRGQAQRERLAPESPAAQAPVVREDADPEPATQEVSSRTVPGAVAADRMAHAADVAASDATSGSLPAATRRPRGIAAIAALALAVIVVAGYMFWLRAVSPPASPPPTPELPAATTSLTPVPPVTSSVPIDLPATTTVPTPAPPEPDPPPGPVNDVVPRAMKSAEGLRRAGQLEQAIAALVPEALATPAGAQLAAGVIGDAERRTTAARRAADQRGAGDSPAYARARQHHQQAEAARTRRGQPAAAVRLFLEAAGEYERAMPQLPSSTTSVGTKGPVAVTSTTVPPSPPATTTTAQEPPKKPPTVPINPEPLILAQLDAFERAYESRSVAAVQEVWPSMPDSWRQSLQKSFRDYSSVEWQFTGRVVTVNGDTASVLADATVTSVTGGRRFAAPGATSSWFASATMSGSSATSV